MISYLMGRNEAILAAIGLLIAFAGTIVFTAIFCDRLPKDGGRAFAHDGKLSAGKPRGAGLIFVVVFTIAAFLFVPLSTETIIYLILVAAEMITGYMDDASEKPWGEWKKGILDLVIAIIVAVTYLNFNSNEIYLAFLHKTVAIPELVFGILIVMDNRRVSANSHRLITQPCKAFTNIFNVFACNCHDNVIGLCHLLLFRTFFTYKGKCLICEQAIFCINLAVMDARHALCKKIFLLKVSSTRNCCNFTQFLVFHTIRAKLPEQFI